MTNGIYKIEKVECNQLNALVNLYGVCFDRHKDASFFKWKYFSNPSGDALCLSVMHQGDMAGFCCMIPEEFYVFGNKMKIYKCCDLMVHPKYRKRGLSTKLILALSEHLRRHGPLFLYTLCGKNATPGFLKNEWLKSGDVYYYFKHRSYLKFKFLFYRMTRLYEEGILKRVDSIADLCKNYKFKIDNSKIHMVKNEAYFKWRLSNLLYDYKITGYYEKDVLVGYVICNTKYMNDAYIIDLECEGNNRKIIKTLLDSVESDAYRSGRRSVITFTVKDTILHKLIKENGYISNPFARGPLISAMDFNILIDKRHADKELNRSNWDISPLNYDDV